MEARALTDALIRGRLAICSLSYQRSAKHLPWGSLHGCVIGASPSRRDPRQNPAQARQHPYRGTRTELHATCCSTASVIPSARAITGLSSMPKVSDAREDHRDVPLIRGADHFRVAHAAARLNNRDRAVVGDDIEAISEGEERVRRDNRTGE